MNLKLLKQQISRLSTNKKNADDGNIVCSYMEGMVMDILELENLLKDKGPSYIGRHSCFSVMIPLIRKGDDIEVLFEVRSSKIKRQPGEICFPGGMKEKGETDVECAVRETSEELGIPYRDIHIGAEVGTLNTYGGYIIKVYMGEIARDVLEKASPSEVEVAELFTVPLSFFLENEPDIYHSRITSEIEKDFPYELVGFPDGYPMRVIEGEVPVYVYDKYVIWGITGRIMKHFAETLR